MKTKTKSFLLQLPAIILLVIVTLASFYIKIKNLYPTKWITPITLLVIVILFFIGRSLGRKSDFPSF